MVLSFTWFYLNMGLYLVFPSDYSVVFELWCSYYLLYAFLTALVIIKGTINPLCGI